MNNIETTKQKRKSNTESHHFTRECICTALLHLVKKTSFDKITVTSIINRAGVSRAGFYRNYSSKEAVLEDIASSIYARIFDTLFLDINNENFEEKYTAIFQKISEQRDLFDIIATLAHYTPNAFDMTEQLKNNLAKKSGFEYYSCIAEIHAQRAIVLDWYKHGMKESPKEMASIFSKLFLNDNHYNIFS